MTEVKTTCAVEKYRNQLYNLENPNFEVIKELNGKVTQFVLNIPKIYKKLNKNIKNHLVKLYLFVL